MQWNQPLMYKKLHLTPLLLLGLAITTYDSKASASQINDALERFYWQILSQKIRLLSQRTEIFGNYTERQIFYLSCLTQYLPDQRKKKFPYLNQYQKLALSG